MSLVLGWGSSGLTERKGSLFFKEMQTWDGRQTAPPPQRTHQAGGLGVSSNQPLPKQSWEGSRAAPQLQGPPASPRGPFPLLLSFSLWQETHAGPSARARASREGVLTWGALTWGALTWGRTGPAPRQDLHN